MNKHPSRMSWDELQTEIDELQGESAKLLEHIRLLAESKRILRDYQREREADHWRVFSEKVGKFA